jgi:hypothetical protein
MAKSKDTMAKKSKIKVKDITATIPRRSVAFSHVELHEFKLVIGDSPSVSKGVPIALGPKLERKSVVEINFYEKFRSRRTLRQLVIKQEDREEM